MGLNLWSFWNYSHNIQLNQKGLGISKFCSIRRPTPHHSGLNLNNVQVKKLTKIMHIQKVSY